MEKLSIHCMLRCISQKRKIRIASIIPNSGGNTQSHYSVVRRNATQGVGE